jgi:hypothetical protein
MPAPVVGRGLHRMAGRYLNEEFAADEEFAAGMSASVKHAMFPIGTIHPRSAGFAQQFSRTGQSTPPLTLGALFCPERENGIQADT